MKKVFIEGNDGRLFNMFEEIGYQFAQTVFNADLLCLEGGADVSPALYGDANTHSHSSPDKDITSFGLISIAQRLGIPVVGICRGSQVMCVHNGGKMKQHIEGHGIYHTLNVYGRKYYVSSSHHQESVPLLDENNIIRADDGTCEITMYRDLNMLGFQPHPEYFEAGHECIDLFKNLVNEVCFNQPRKQL